MNEIVTNQRLVINRARLSSTANPSGGTSDGARESCINYLISLNDYEWEDIKEWASKLPNKQYYDNVREMCLELQVLRDLQD